MLAIFFKKAISALAGVPEWIECQPVNQRVTSSIPSQDTCLGCSPGSHWGVRKRQPHIYVLSLSFSFLSPLSKNK